MASGNLKYAVITAARNEEVLIENTIRSVVAQTIRPVRWIIVSDGSTDGTDEIVKRYAHDYPWIELLRMPEHRDRQFAAKARCLMAAYAIVQSLDFDVICSLDADITFDSDYMAFLLDKLARDPSLGVVGTRFIENSRRLYDYRFMNEKHVSGGCQLFRRKCFEDIGGYLPLRRGGEDWAAVTIARMKGWRTQSYTERLFIHHRPMGTCGHSLLRAQFRQGESDYLTGGHPLWQVFRSLFQMSRKPYVFSGLCLFLGFACALVRRVERPVPPELILFHRAEQMARLRSVLFPWPKSAGQDSPRTMNKA